MYIYIYIYKHLKLLNSAIIEIRNYRNTAITDKAMLLSTSIYASN